MMIPFAESGDITRAGAFGETSAANGGLLVKEKDVAFNPVNIYFLRANRIVQHTDGFHLIQETRRILRGRRWIGRSSVGDGFAGFIGSPLIVWNRSNSVSLRAVELKPFVPAKDFALSGASMPISALLKRQK